MSVVLIQDSSGGSGSWVLLENGLQTGGTALAMGICCWMPSLPVSWNLRGNWVCYMQRLLGPVIFGRWIYYVCMLHLRYMGTASSALKKCWMCWTCLSWLSCLGATGIASAPAWLQEGFALFSRCVYAMPVQLGQLTAKLGTQPDYM